MTKPIGSYFEAPGSEWLGSSPNPQLPWGAQPHLMLATGQHALRVVASDLTRRGIDRIWLPSYLCASMVRPFARGGIDCSFYEVTDDLEPRDGSLDVVAANAALLICRFFGRGVPASTVAAVAAAHDRGVVVVSDTTHAPFEEVPWCYDFNIVSLRKSLPVHDGAVLVGDVAVDGNSFKPLSRERVAARAIAATAKQEALVGGEDPSPWNAQLRNFEEYLSGVVEPAPMTDESLAILHSLDTARLVTRRNANLSALARRLGEVSAVFPLPGYHDGSRSSYYTCSTARARETQQKLALDGIFCPIHWPQPDELRGRPWRSDLLSFPIDHRYDLADMDRIAESLQTNSHEEVS